MRTHCAFMRTAHRVPVNLSVPAGLLAAAKARRINLSRLFEQRLSEVLAADAGDPFAEENREAVAAYNARVAAEGVFSDEHRSF